MIYHVLKNHVILHVSVRFTGHLVNLIQFCDVWGMYIIVHDTTKLNLEVFL